MTDDEQEQPQHHPLLKALRKSDQPPVARHPAFLEALGKSDRPAGTGMDFYDLWDRNKDPASRDMHPALREALFGKHDSPPSVTGPALTAGQATPADGVAVAGCGDW